MKYIIIGASAAGLACAEQIRKEDKTGEITVFTKEKYLPYSRPSISYYLKGIVKENNMYLRKNSYYEANDIDIITGTEIKSIDTKVKAVKAGRKSYQYDRLCICTGSKPFIPPMKNVNGKSNALTFLDLESTKQIKSKADKNTKAVVIGAGLIGMKAAEGLSKVCQSVDVVELAPRVLPSILDNKSAKSVKKYIETEGNICFHLEQTVTEAKSEGDRITSVILSSGKELPCDLLILAVGVRPETELAEKAGLEVNRGIITDPETMRTSDENVFAAGDCAVSTDMLDGSKRVIALWPNAVNQGIVAGSQMAGGNEKITGSFSVNAIDFYGLRICTCGLINAQGSRYRDKTVQKGGSYKRLIFEGSRLVGYVLINSSDNAGIYTSLIESKEDLSKLSGKIFDTPGPFLFCKEERKARMKGEPVL